MNGTGAFAFSRCVRVCVDVARQGCVTIEPAFLAIVTARLFRKGSWHHYMAHLPRPRRLGS
jgi:hypothetical protein